MSKRYSAISILAVLLLIIALHYTRVLKPAEQMMGGAVHAFSGAIYNVGVKVKEFVRLFEDKEDLRASYDKLSQDYEHALVDRVRFQILSEENDELRKQLGFFSSSTYSHMGAEIIGKTIDPIATTIIINRGSDHGVAVGLPVVSGAGILVGKITALQPRTSIVRLLYDSQSRVAATVLNTGRSVGIVEGGYGISVRMNFIPQNEHIAPGDTVVTSGLEADIPKGLLIGTIEVVEQKPYEPFQEAILDLTYDQGKTNLVSIMIPVPGL